MKKILFLIIFLFLFVNLINSQVSDNIESRIFEAVEESVVFIEIDLYLDKQYFSKKDLVKKLETEYKVKILDNYIMVQTGSGFIITPSGYLLTNFHVVNIEDENQIKKELLNSITYDFLSKIPTDILSSSDFGLLKGEFKNALDNSKFHYRALVKNKDYFDCDIDLKNKDLDASLLKIKSDKKFKPLLLGNSDNLKVGNAVMAIGYPLSDLLFYLFKEMKSSMTTGNVSVIRNDNWGIQHTSAINPGNSGGPLFNRNGEVIGVNVGVVKESNSIFFAIPSNKMINWLNANGRQDIVKINANTGRSYNTEFTKNQNGYIEAGKNILVKIPEGYKVYVDGAYKGATPLLLENINEGVHTIRIESDAEFSEEQFLIKNSINDILSYTPFLKKHTGYLVIMSSPSGAGVMIDDQEMGVTPFVLNSIDVGSHKIKLKQDGYIQFERTVEIKKGQKIQINETLVKGYKVTFKNTLPEGVFIKISGNRKEWTFGMHDGIVLEKGKYRMTLSEKDSGEKSADFEITDKDIVLDIEFSKFKGFINFTNLKEGSRVFIDGVDYTDKIRDNKIEIDVGKYKIIVKKGRFNDFITEILVERDKTGDIRVSYTLPVRDYTFYKGIATGLVVPGVICLFSGLAIVVAGAVTYPSFTTGNYSFYGQTMADMSVALFAAGGSVLGLGLALIISGACVQVYSVKIKRGLISFNINLQKGIGAEVAYRF